jgi:hypothetical protein
VEARDTKQGRGELWKEKSQNDALIPSTAEAQVGDFRFPMQRINSAKMQNRWRISGNVDCYFSNIYPRRLTDTACSTKSAFLGI